MKKIVWLGAVLFGLAACENNSKVETRVDSLQKTLDTLLDRAGDSAKKKGEQTLEAIKEKVEAIGKKEDSIRLDTIIIVDTVRIGNL